VTCGSKLGGPTSTEHRAPARSGYFASVGGRTVSAFCVSISEPATQGRTRATLRSSSEPRCAPWARAWITPVVGVGLGLLTEPEFTGEIIRGTLALELEVSNRLALRVGGQLGRHGGQRGPHVLFGGLELRGRRR
jgi:hypothetical protein